VTSYPRFGRAAFRVARRGFFFAITLPLICDDVPDLRLGAEYKLTKALKLTGAVTGLTDGAADWGLFAGLVVRF